MSGQMAIRHPKRGKAYRSTKNPHAPANYAGHTACGKWARDMTEVLLVERTAPEDRCKTCWPTPIPDQHDHQED